MSKVFQNKGFNFGLCAGLCLFGFFNLLSYVKAVHEYDTRPIKFSGGGYNFGFPYGFYQAIIGYPNEFHFDWLALVADILLAVVFSFVVGLIFKFVWSKNSSRRFELK